MVLLVFFAGGTSPDPWRQGFPGPVDSLVGLAGLVLGSTDDSRHTSEYAQSYILVFAPARDSHTIIEPACEKSRDRASHPGIGIMARAGITMSKKSFSKILNFFEAQ